MLKHHKLNVHVEVDRTDQTRADYPTREGREVARVARAYGGTLKEGGKAFLPTLPGGL